MVIRRDVVQRAVLVTAAAGTAMLSASCGAAPAGGPTTRVDVVVKNFHIELPATIPTGKVVFVVHGQGPTLHEFNVARSDLTPGHLPLADDDTVDDTHNTDQFYWLGQVEGIDVGMTKTFTATITPGHYVFYCNMDGHYMAGMSAQATAQ